MKTNVFVKTKNVKNFVALMEELKKLPPNIPKITLVYGEYGLGKSETIKWWTFRNECIYVRANQGMSTRWLLSDIAEELNIETFWHIDETFNEIVKTLVKDRKTIIVDEVDYLIDKKTIETLRDLHDRTGCPLVLVGMANVNTKLARYPHLIDRIYKQYEFQKYKPEDIKQILEELTEVPFTADGLEYLSTRENQFRQLVKLLNKIEKKAETNQIKILDENTLRGLLNERTNIKTLQFSPTLGIKCNGNYLILSSSAFLKTENVSTLLDVMETNVSEKYFLSAEQAAKILAQVQKEA